jgi:hypothetical protein
VSELIGDSYRVVPPCRNGDAVLVSADANDEDHGVEELVDDVVLLAKPVVRERSVADAALDQERRSLRDAHRPGHLDVHVGAVVEDPHGLPGDVGTVDLVVTPAWVSARLPSAAIATRP